MMKTSELEIVCSSKLNKNYLSEMVGYTFSVRRKLRKKLKKSNYTLEIYEKNAVVF